MSHKWFALVLAKVAPWVGGLTFFAAIEATGSTDAWTEVWRICMSAGLGIFVTLVGAIYKNMDRRLEALEEAAKNDFVPRKEYDSRHDDMIRQLDMIHKAVTDKR